MSVESFNKGKENLVEENSKEFRDSLAELKYQISKPWEVTYLNTDVIDSTPEMTHNEIMNLSEDVLYELWDYHSKKYNKYTDKIGNYYIINGKKLYAIYPRELGRGHDHEIYSEKDKYIFNNKPFIEFIPGGNGVNIIKKVGDDYMGIGIETEGLYRGKFSLEKENGYPIFFKHVKEK